MKSTLRSAAAGFVALTLLLAPALALAFDGQNDSPDAQHAPSFSGIISGKVFNDLNNNGVRDSGEPYLEDWEVDLHRGDAHDGYDNDVVATDYTDAGGNFYFNDLDAGNYFVEEIEQDGWDQTTSDAHVTLDSDNADAPAIHFANVQLAVPPPAYVPEVGGLIIANVIVGGSATADQFSFSLDGVASTTFDLSGSNSFFAMATGTYTIAETATSTYAATYDNCAGIVVSANATSTCTITNTYIAPADTDPAGANPGGDTDNGAPAPAAASSGGGGGGVVMGGPLGIGFVNTNAAGGSTAGLVLGDSTDVPSCDTPLLTTYMRQGKNNDKGEVAKLQTFLNAQLGLAIPVTGFFGSQTTAAVNKLQTKYQSDILGPWSAFGHDGHTPTGYVYKTTQREINMLACSNLNLPAPQLP